MLCILVSNLIVHSTLFYCVRRVQDQIPDSTPLFKIICFRTHSIIFAVRRFVFKIMRFWFLHHQISSPSTGYLVLWRDGKAKSHCFPSKRKQHLFKSHLCCAYWSQTWYCIQPCFNVYAGYKIKFQTRPHGLSFSVSLHNHLSLR